MFHRSTLGTALLVAAFVWTIPASADEPASTPSAFDIGLRLEEVRAKPKSFRVEELLQLQDPTVGLNLALILEDDLDDMAKSAAYFLSGEIEFELGNTSRAREFFEEAASKDKKGPFADDAKFAEIRSLELAGKDEEAREEWEDWEKKYDDSVLYTDARIALAWNYLRAADWRRARATVDQISEESSWASTDARVVAARAVLEFAAGDIEACLNELEAMPEPNATSTYLTALCLDAQGEVLKAAAAYQEVFERYPESALRDRALYAKANTFLKGGAYRSAAEEFAMVTEISRHPELRAEAMLRRGASFFQENNFEEAVPVLRQLVDVYPDSDAAARGQYLIGEIAMATDDSEAAIREYNRVLRDYFEHQVAASAQYRIGRCYEDLGRRAAAVSAYETVVRGYPLEAEAPPAAYLAGAGLLEMDRPLDAAPYFQIVLDRYAGQPADDAVVVFATEEQKEVVEAALCLLLLSYHRAGDLGQLSGAPNLMLQKMPASNSSWRAYALLLAADALAAQGRYDEALASLEELRTGFRGHEVELPATQLLAWTYAQKGEDDLAIRTERDMLQRFASSGSGDALASAYVRMAHVRFNQKNYADAVEIYEEYRDRYPEGHHYALATYQAGVSYSRLGRDGDAVDRWEALVALYPSDPIAEKAWARAGDLYFRTGYYEDAKRCYEGLLTHFESSAAGATGMLRLAQCDFNAGRDREALQGYASVIQTYPHTMSAQEAERGMELALYRLGQQDTGGEVLAELIEKYPNSGFAADAQFQIASGLYEEARYEESAEEFRRVVSRYPSYDAVDRAQFLIGEAWSQAGNVDQSIQAYQQFLMFFPESELRTTVQFRLGLQLFEREDYMDAAVKFTAVVDQGDNEELRPAALFNLATAQQLLGDTAGSRASLERYRENYPTDERELEIALQLGNLNEAEGDWEAAITEYERALNTGVGEEAMAEVLYRVGQCREYLTDLDGALIAYKRAMSNGPSRDPYRLSAVARSAAIYEDQEDYAGALDAYRDLIRNSSDEELVAVAQTRADELEAFLQ
jgi:TolA-binding protein